MLSFTFTCYSQFGDDDPQWTYWKGLKHGETKQAAKRDSMKTDLPPLRFRHPNLVTLIGWGKHYHLPQGLSGGTRSKIGQAKATTTTRTRRCRRSLISNNTERKNQNTQELKIKMVFASLFSHKAPKKRSRNRPNRSLNPRIA